MDKRMTMILVQFIAFTVALISTCVLVGHYLEFTRMYRWSVGDVGMAIPTAICLNGLSIAVALLGRVGELEARLLKKAGTS